MGKKATTASKPIISSVPAPKAASAATGEPVTVDSPAASSAPSEATPPQHRVFFSWQSDLPQKDTTNAIRAALRTAANDVEKELDGAVSIYNDEATRGASGSPYIPGKIQAKIDVADTFVGDVSVSVRAAAGEKSSPNPNVMFELGYAVATLGWDRVVLVINEEYCDLKELPFDIDRHRVARYRFKTPDPSDPTAKSTVKGMESTLASLMKDAIKAVIVNDPPRPADLKGLSPEEMRRQRDVKNLTLLMQRISLDIMDDFFDRASLMQIPQDSVTFYEDVMRLVGSASFFIYDATTSDIVKKFLADWVKVHSFYAWFDDTGSDTWAFRDIIREGHHVTPEYHKQWQNAAKGFQRTVRSMYQSFQALLNHIRKEYVTIDVDTASGLAYDEWRRRMKEVEDRFAKLGVKRKGTAADD